MRKFVKEFREFITRGNVLDLAVAVIIGSAFSAIVTALTNGIIMPVVNYVLALIGGKEGLEGAYTILSRGYTDGVLDLSKSIYINWGALISAILNFIIIALTLFLIIKIFNHSRQRLKLLHSKVVVLSRKDKRQELQEMKKEAKERGVSYRQVKKEREEQRQRLLKEEEDRKALEEKQKQEEQLRKEREHVELLKEIRDLLKKERV